MGILGRQDKASDWRYVVTFSLDDQSYAVPIESVIKITQVSAMIPSPHPESNVAGWIQIEQRRIPAVNMRRHHGLTEMALEPHTPVIVLQIDETVLALIVDKLSGAVRVPAALITRSSEGLSGTVMQTPQGSTLLVNLENLFTPEQMKAFTNLKTG
ncbi:MAG: chemotaxis protein CheW [Chloroflexi bacterium]|nr:chemotaxis protein CheW [Chloroflexota bacterium]